MRELAHELLRGRTGHHQHGFLQVFEHLLFGGKQALVFVIAEIGDRHDLFGNTHRRTHQVEFTFHGPLQQHVHHQHPVDLVGTFKNAVDPGIAVGAFHRRVG